MKKILVLIVGLVSLAALAGVEAPFAQFVLDDFVFTNKPGQLGIGSRMISLKVPAGKEVWLSGIITNWYGENDDLNTVFNMSSEKFGYFAATDSIKSASIEKSDYSANGITITNGDGATTDVTFTNNNNPAVTATTTAYLLGYFEDATEIFLAMSPRDLISQEDLNEEVDSYQFVAQAGHDATILESRQLTNNGLVPDAAGNIRIVFGIANQTPNAGQPGHEFVVIYSTPTPTAGQPLPGLLVAGLLSFGTVTLGSKMKKRS